MGWTREAIADRVRLVGDAERVLLLIPSSRITERMKLERAGVWLERSAPTPNLWMVAKLPMNVIRAVHAGAAVALELWVVEIDEAPISGSFAKVGPLRRGSRGVTEGHGRREAEGHEAAKAIVRANGVGDHESQLA